MYHDVTPQAVAGGGGSDFFSVSQASFAHQLSLIEASGLRGCSIADILAGGKRIASRSRLTTGILGRRSVPFRRWLRAG